MSSVIYITIYDEIDLLITLTHFKITVQIKHFQNPIENFKTTNVAFSIDVIAYIIQMNPIHYS